MPAESPSPKSDHLQFIWGARDVRGSPGTLGELGTLSGARGVWGSEMCRMCVYFL